MAAALSATACAILKVPFEKPGTSNTPIGPFHTIVFARAISSEKRRTVYGPMSNPIQPSGVSLTGTVRVCVSARNSAPTT
jgi:hypothetical protein